MLSKGLIYFLVLWFYNSTTIKFLRNSKTSTLVEMYFSPLQMNNFQKVLRTSTGKCTYKSQINCIFLDSNMVSWIISNGFIYLQNICVVSLLSKLLLFSCSVTSSSLQPSGLQHVRLPVFTISWSCSYSGPLSWWCHPAIWSSVTPFPSFSKLGENKCWLGFPLLCHCTSATFLYILF